MMRVKETKVYQFDELNDRAKERARDWFRTASTNDFQDYQAETVIDYAARLGAMLGIDICQKPVKLMNGSTRMDPLVHWSGFSSQGDGASYSGHYRYVKGGTRAVAKEAPTGIVDNEEGRLGYEGNNELNRIARELQAVQRRNFFRLVASISAGRGHYAHSRTMNIDVERTDGNPVSDEDTETLSELLRDFADWIYRSLEREYEFQNSDEVIDENIRANEYEFNEEGGRE